MSADIGETHKSVQGWHVRFETFLKQLNIRIAFNGDIDNALKNYGKRYLYNRYLKKIATL